MNRVCWQQPGQRDLVAKVPGRPLRRFGRRWYTVDDALQVFSEQHRSASTEPFTEYLRAQFLSWDLRHFIQPDWLVRVRSILPESTGAQLHLDHV